MMGDQDALSSARSHVSSRYGDDGGVSARTTTSSMLYGAVRAQARSIKPNPYNSKHPSWAQWDKPLAGKMGWTHKPTYRTASEMRENRRRSMLPDPSYDVDGDGVVNQKDFRLASKFDTNNDGVLQTEERNLLRKRLVADQLEDYKRLQGTLVNAKNIHNEPVERMVSSFTHDVDRAVASDHFTKAFNRLSNATSGSLNDNSVEVHTILHPYATEDMTRAKPVHRSKSELLSSRRRQSTHYAEGKLNYDRWGGKYQYPNRRRGSAGGSRESSARSRAVPHGAAVRDPREADREERPVRIMGLGTHISCFPTERQPPGAGIPSGGFLPGDRAAAESARSSSSRRPPSPLYNEVSVKMFGVPAEEQRVAKVKHAAETQRATGNRQRRRGR